MMDKLNNQELLSALVDGELHGDEWAQALSCAEDAQGCASWQLYHLVGDVLRSPDLAHHSQHDLLTGLRAQLAAEPPLQLAPAELQQISAAMVSARAAAGAPASTGAAVVALRDPAANAAVFRWKVAASFATVAAVAAIGWHLMAVPVGGVGPQLASAQPAPAVVAVSDAEGEGVILRDPRLDALMASHQQYASRAALQAPADFLRNASFAAARSPHAPAP